MDLRGAWVPSWLRQGVAVHCGGSDEDPQDGVKDAEGGESVTGLGFDAFWAAGGEGGG